VKKATLFILSIMVVLLGCTNKEKDQKSTSQEKNIPTPIRTEPSFMTSQEDAFNKGNKIESSRKKKLADFGIINVSLPTPTPNIDIARDILNPNNMKKNNIIVFTNYSWNIPSFPFDYENDIAVLKSLYKLHNLDRVIPENGSDMVKMQSLMKYTYTFLNGGKLPEQGSVTGPSAFLITENRRVKGIGGTSEVYAVLLCQLSLSCGYNSRIISMHAFDSNGKPLTHDVCETYVNSQGKWVAFDAYNSATYYLRDSIPQSALELHKVAVENRIREIYPVSVLHETTEIASLRDQVLPMFKYIYMWRMNNILSSSPRNGSISWQALYQTHLVWEDALSLVSEGGFDKIDKFSQGGVKFVTHTRSDFEWMLDHVNTTLERKDNDRIAFYLTTFTPNFDYFEIKIDSNQKTPIKNNIIKSKNVFINQTIRNAYIITPVNKLGTKGFSSFVEFE